MNRRSARPYQPRSVSAQVQLALLLGAVLVVALYALARYGSRWGETDTASYTQFLRAMYSEGRLMPESVAYPNGYGYTVLGVFLAYIGGGSLPNLQLYASALLAIWVVLPAWLLYREFTSSSRAATLASVILLIQPEFLFPILRGTHEKFTRGLMFLCMYLLLRSFRSRENLRLFAAFILAFYLCAYALITFNNFLATSFIIALGLALVLIWLARRRLASTASLSTPTFRRMGYVILSLLAVAFVFTFYAYPPAQLQIQVLRSIGDRLAALFLQVETAATNPYITISEGWVSLPVYFIVSLANWLLLVFSFTIWLGQSFYLYIRRQPINKQSELLLWAFYGAFALQGILSIVVDISGAIASNMQHRIFPSFAMIAAPLAASWLVQWRSRHAWARWVFRTGLWLGISILALLSTLKALNEPLLSNKWVFHLPAEMQAVRWADQYLINRSMWTEFDERIEAVIGIRTDLSGLKVVLDQFEAETTTRDFLVSTVTRLRSLRLGQPLPIEADSLITYDNGQAQIYHLRPRTPYQR